MIVSAFELYALGAMALVAGFVFGYGYALIYLHKNGHLK